MSDIQLDGDPRKLAIAIYRATLESYKSKNGNPLEGANIREELEDEAATLAKQMVEALDAEVRDVYLMNALEVMALSYAERDF
jgi:hypothetical protein